MNCVCVLQKLSGIGYVSTVMSHRSGALLVALMALRSR